MKKTHDSKIQAFSLDDESIKNLNELSEALKIKKSTLVRLLINQAKKNSNLCRMIERDRAQEIVEDFVKRKGLPWERTKYLVLTELESNQDKQEQTQLINERDMQELIRIARTPVYDGD